MQNESGLRPTGVAVLVRPVPPKKQGMIELPEMVQERVAVVDNRMEVVEVGPAAWYDEPVPRAKAGDQVLVTKYAGFMAKGPKDGKIYRLVNDRDIFCTVEDGE